MAGRAVDFKSEVSGINNISAAYYAVCKLTSSLLSSLSDMSIFVYISVWGSTGCEW